MYAGATIGGLVGGFVPALWGAGLLDLSSIFWGSVGMLAGLWAGYKAGKYFGL